MAKTDANARRNAPIMTDSLAYDLSRQAQTAERYSAAPELQRPPRPRRQTQTAARPAPSRAMVVAPAAVVLFAVAIVAWVLTLQVKAQVTEAQRTIYRMESALSTVEQRRDELEIEYETAFNFTELEDYAVGVLGMQRPRDEQVFFLSNTAEDHAVAVAENAKSNGLVDRFGDFLADLASYFH